MSPVIGASLTGIREMIEEIPVLTEIQKKFYYTVMEYRYNKVFQPLYQRISKKEGSYVY